MLGVAVQAGQIERRHAVAIAGRGVGSAAQQQVGDRQLVGMDRMVERGRPVDALGVHIDAALDEQAHESLVPVFGGVRQPAVRGEARRPAGAARSGRRR